MSLIPEALKGHIGRACQTYSDAMKFAGPVAADMAVAVLDSKLNVNGNSFIIRTAEPLEKYASVSPVELGRHGNSIDRGGNYVS